MWYIVEYSLVIWQLFICYFIKWILYVRVFEITECQKWYVREYSLVIWHSFICYFFLTKHILCMKLTKCQKWYVVVEYSLVIKWIICVVF